MIYLPKIVSRMAKKAFVIRCLNTLNRSQQDGVTAYRNYELMNVSLEKRPPSAKQ